MSESPNLKMGERMVRYCQKKRSDAYTAVQEYTVFSDIFDGIPAVWPHHVHQLYAYLRKVFCEGCPVREKTASETPANAALRMQGIDSDLPGYASRFQYRTWGKAQHPIVQEGLLRADPRTIAIEVPVYDNDSNGFIDVLRLHPENGWRIEVADIKPNIPMHAKNNPDFPMGTKTMQQIAAQLDKYRRMLYTRIDLAPESGLIYCTAFDDEAAFLLL